jgi:CrcB protein
VPVERAPVGARQPGIDSHHHFEHHDARLPIDPDRPPPELSRARQLDVLAAVAAGGFLGALGRYELGLAWPTPGGHFPWTTFTINVSGGFLLGLVLTVLLERVGAARYVRPFFCVGVLGAWTTMSTFAGEGDILLRDGHAGTAVLYALATLVVGVTATWIGVALARTFDPLPDR